MISWAVLLLVITAICTLLYYLNYPVAETAADTPGYLDVVRQLQRYGSPVHPFRLPIYPLFLIIVFFFSGQGNVWAVNCVQGVLFVVTTLECYLLTVLIVRRGWLAFLVSLLFGTNLLLLSYYKPMMTEGFACWLLTSIVLCSALYLSKHAVRYFWLAFVCTGLLLFTRPEWVFLPILLFAYFLLFSKGQGRFRTFLRRGGIAVGLIYALIGAYIAANTIFNHYPGITYVENMNVIGKVLQYDMQNEPPVSDERIRRILDHYQSQGSISPYYIVGHEPTLRPNYVQAAASFARNVILHHPLEFLLKSIPYFFTSLYRSYPVSLNQAQHPGPYQVVIQELFAVHQYLYLCNILFPCCAVAWLFLLSRSRWRGRKEVQVMGLIVLTVSCAVIITTLGGYYETDYMRVHTVFDLLIIVTVWGTLLLGLQYICRKVLYAFAPSVGNIDNGTGV